MSANTIAALLTLGVICSVPYLVWSAFRLWRQSGSTEPMVQLDWQPCDPLHAGNDTTRRLLTGPNGVLNPASPTYLLEQRK